jgi:hypothetical protein
MHRSDFLTDAVDTATEALVAKGCFAREHVTAVFERDGGDKGIGLQGRQPDGMPVLVDKAKDVGGHGGRRRGGAGRCGRAGRR